MNTPEEKRHLATAFVIGSILGAGIALIFAPQSGRKTRRDIRRFGQKAANKAEALQIEVRQSVDDLATDISEKIQEEFERGRDWTEKKVQDVRNALDRGREFISKELNKIGLA
jgi:gas vesicle protein